MKKGLSEKIGENEHRIFRKRARCQKWDGSRFTILDLNWRIKRHLEIHKRQQYGLYQGVRREAEAEYEP